MPLSDGIYEQIINNYISEKLKSADSDSKLVEKERIDKDDSQKILSDYLSLIIRTSLGYIKEKDGTLEKQISVCNNLIKYLAEETKEDSLNHCLIGKNGEILLSLFDKMDYPSISQKKISRPETSISKSSLFTGSALEPSMLNELRLEIESADRIDILVSFVKWSGIRLIKDELLEFSKRGKLRLITTSYTGATDIKAVEFLESLDNTEVKVSYDTKRTRLHAKAYTFYRKTGFSTAYIGSSNLSNPAITSGLEWNVKITEKDTYDLLKKVEATFESYWNDSEFKTYSPEDAKTLADALLSEKYYKESGDITPFDIKPYDYQREILEKLEADRKVHGNYRNLLVSATGTGKTVISAFDYKNLKKELGYQPRLLFVAHREEILKQSLSVFRGVLKDSNFGELLVGNCKPEDLENLFISIQSFNSKDLTEFTPPDYYDMIIVDEFHHAAAPSYQKLLSYYTPKILLGLTATPERMDNFDVLSYFNGKVSAEIRLPEAIDRKLLCPFHYFGVSDTVDLDSIAWKRGGYDRGELSRLYIGNNGRISQIIKGIETYVTNIDDVIGLGFCVSIEHAKYMADSFNSLGIMSACLHSKSPKDERNSVQKKLVSKEIHFIFVVDLYNEGVDIPEINTVLFLRPTESLTVFLQQLGRGLRLCDGKECLTVLDFVGRQNINFRFDTRLLALTSSNRTSIKKQIKDDVYSLPKGCYIHLEKVAREKVLENIKASWNNKKRFVEIAKSFELDTGKKISLAGFVDHYGISLDEIYSKTTFNEICSLAGLCESLNVDENDFLRKSALRNPPIMSKSPA
ncbi:NgoFVII family restriction endonuclease [Methanoplanus sp. FWC-SCC4]|uniref:NgoFVII family restriction endonuclease n=1 Tax=Methanochimaera problematica TaxID=2609417 RepID=A0AA97FEK4_9EURY|nr:DEAD/DEAH box helicase family protein [Methanoplanus sp. FWC-SCC4]WOF16789.1 NgoFVII family restriction endonuclease [Methanoplanus sp. FWC-SCC4]